MHGPWLAYRRRVRLRAAVTIPNLAVSTLPAPAQKILDPASPPPLRAMAAKGVVPGLRPPDVLAVLVLLAASGDVNADAARSTLGKLPAPLLNGALGAPDLHPAVLDALAPLYASDAAISERVLTHPNLAPATVASVAQGASESLCELIATNEERLLAHPEIIEKLYLNKHCRMSTADRILELAVRHNLELRIPAFGQAKEAIRGELIVVEPDGPTFDDTQFEEASALAKDLVLEESEDTHELDPETGTEAVTPKAKPLHAIWTQLRPAAKIRFLNLATLKTYDASGKVIGEERYDVKALRLLGIRDSNPLVAVAALETPGISDNEIVRISSMRNVSEDVLRAISNSREWTRHYMVKMNLVANPRTPYANAVKFVLHLRENDLKTLAKSRDVSGQIQSFVKQQLARKAK